MRKIFAVSLQDTLRRKPDVILRRLPDIVVDLDKFSLSVPAGLDVDLPGVVTAGRDGIEITEIDGCHCFFSFRGRSCRGVLFRP